MIVQPRVVTKINWSQARGKRVSMFYKICELCKDTSSSLMVLYVWMVGPGAVVSFFVLCVETKWLHGSQSMDPEIFSGMSEVLCGLLLWVEGDEF